MNKVTLPPLASFEADFGSRPDPALVGAKAAGLLRLPRAWVPPFLFFTLEFHRIWNAGEGGYSTVDSLLANSKSLIEGLLDNPRQRRLLVRSNGPSETMEARGSSKSVVVNLNRENLVDIIYNMLRRGGRLELPLIQRVIEPGMLGHMSNERRVSAQPVKWLIESGPPINYVYITAAESYNDAPLKAANRKELVTRLREVAGFLSYLADGRFHCEWIWDGKNVWIVQADISQEAAGEESFSLWLTSPTEVPSSLPDNFKVLVHFSSEEGRGFHKLRCPLLFRDLGMPAAEIFLLPGERWVKSSIEGHAYLTEDLQSFGGAEIVVRCDVSHENRSKELLLPTSKPIKTVDGVLEFMAMVCARFRSYGFDDNQWAFLINTLVPSRAGAVVHAFPRGKKVRIDALWGFPDGLLHFPHDTYFYFPVDRKVAARVRYKSTALMSKPEWQPISVPPPFDWRRVLSNREIMQLGDWGLAVAKKLESEIQLMALVRVGGQRGAKGCLPWHFTTLTVPTYKGSVPHIPSMGDLKLITSYEDLASLESGEAVAGLLVRPIPKLLRESEFLRSIGQLAASKRVPIYFEGSLLGHAYYILSSSGATVIPVFPENEPQEVPSRYNKLVRDQVPAIIRNSGGVARVRSLSRAEARVLLAQKVLEEAFEVWGSSAEFLPEELADLLEVTEALRNHVGISLEVVDTIRNAKRKERGGFEHLFFLEETFSRTLEHADDNEGLLPLAYGDSQLPESADNESDPLLIVSQSDDEFIRIRMPLIPPVRRGQALSKIDTALDELEISVTYSGVEVEISVRRRHRSEAGQLDLFPELVRSV